MTSNSACRYYCRKSMGLLNAVAGGYSTRSKTKTQIIDCCEKPSKFANKYCPIIAIILFICIIILIILIVNAKHQYREALLTEFKLGNLSAFFNKQSPFESLIIKKYNNNNSTEETTEYRFQKSELKSLWRYLEYCNFFQQCPSDAGGGGDKLNCTKIGRSFCIFSDLKKHRRY